MRLLFVMLIALFATTAASAAEFTTKVTNLFVADELRWRTQGVSYKFLWGLTYVDGRIAVCGVGQFVNPTLRKKTLTQMKRGKVVLDGKAILKDITFFTTIPAGKSLSKAKATCRDTGKPKPSGDFLVYLDVKGRSTF